MLRLENMKVKFSNLLTSFAALLLFAFSVQAQEESPVLEAPEATHREINLDEDKTLINDHPNHTTTIKDSVQIVPRMIVQPAKNARPDANKENRKEKGEEDALSFNFLYYMIQKFKLSDLIDQ